MPHSSRSITVYLGPKTLAVRSIRSKCLIAELLPGISAIVKGLITELLVIGPVRADCLVPKSLPGPALIIECLISKGLKGLPVATIRHIPELLAGHLRIRETWHNRHQCYEQKLLHFPARTVCCLLPNCLPN